MPESIRKELINWREKKMSEVKCAIWGCKNPAKYLVLNYGYEQALCWKHLRMMHTPENNPNVITLGDIEGWDTFKRLGESFDKKKKELGIEWMS